MAARDPGELAPVAAWRAAYQALGAKPKRTRPSVEALLRRVEAGLPRIDRLTDIYNAISVRYLLPVGGEDPARYDGSARLTRAAGDEPFDTVRDGEPVTGHPEPGEVIWRDDAGVICRCWNWRRASGPGSRTRPPAPVDPRRSSRARPGRPGNQGGSWPARWRRAIRAPGSAGARSPGNARPVTLAAL